MTRVRDQWRTTSRAWVGSAIGLVALVATVMISACSPAGMREPESTQVREGESGSVALQDIRIAAPNDCELNPACGPGLRLVYGAHISDNVISVPIDQTLAILDRGEAQVAVVSSLEPAIALKGRSDLVVLEDDRGMIGPGNIVPIVRGALIRGNSTLGETLNAISAVLEEEPLAELLEDVDSLGNERAAALRAVENAGIDLPRGRSEQTLRVGAQAFSESRVLAHLYAEALISAGYTAEVVEVDGYRSTMLYSIVFDDVDITPEYLAPLTDFIAGYGVVDWANRDDAVGELRDLLTLRDLVALEPSPAESVNAFVATKRLAGEAGLATLSDLADWLPVATEAVFPDDTPLLKEGSGPDDPGVGASGERVLDVQLILLGLGFDPGEADGQFGQATRRAVSQFQMSQGLQPDGVVGPGTWEALLNPGPIDPSFFDPEPAAPGDVAPPSEGRTDRTDAGSQVVYLTFDDGPNGTYTPQVLDLLARYDARATFFVTGENVRSHPELAARIAEAGHSVQNHTWNHADLRKLDRAGFAAQVRDTNAAIESAVGVKPSCLRPPYGARNDQVVQWMGEEGMTMVLWDVDPQDWRKPGTATIVREVLENINDGSVVLLHDAGGDRSQTVAALSQILETLSSEGYRFVSGCR